MSAAMKSIYATISNHVQMVGYREIVEAHGRARGLAGFVFNDVDGSVKVMASGLEPVLNEFIHDLKIIRPDTAIETKEIKEDIRLPSPFGKIAIDDVLEYMARFDKGIGILTEHTAILKDQNSTLTEHTALLKDQSSTLTEHTALLKDQSSTLTEHTALLKDQSSTLTEHT
ncbi:MAG: acylphosphatase, partial [ANME-2 cluster archaeon]|nr:acylphosphatase [ANME-2 cluster archaeon]